VRNVNDRRGEKIFSPLFIEVHMSVEFKDFGFYNIDVPYLKHLHDHVDSEIYFSEEKAYDGKPFLGILILIDDYTYFVPLTSGKMKHKKWKNVDKAHYLIYEIIDKSEVRANDIIKPYSDDKVMKLFAALDIRKMIPVPDGLYQRIDFASVQDVRYRSLLEKEYRFCQQIQKGIIEKAERIYIDQKETGKIYPFYCDFVALEKACDAYKENIAKLSGDK
jgi:protein AbiQ